MRPRRPSPHLRHVPRSSAARLRSLALAAVLLLTAPVAPGFAADPVGPATANGGVAEPGGRVALVLGGGAARGTAHVGVIRALTDAGVPIDMILGTSMGSLIGGLYAAGFEVEVLADVVAQVDPTGAAELLLPPRGGILDLQPLAILLDGLLQGRALADTVIPFYPVVIDLFTGEPQAAPPAPLADAIRASTAIPVLFDPVPIGDRYYYDGGLKQTIPASLARALGARYVIAVDVTREIPYQPTNVQANLSRVFVSIVEEYNREELAGTDVVLDPGLRDDTYMDFDRSADFVRAGEAVARAELPRILADLEALGIALRPAGDPNAGHPINDGWRERLALARREVAVRPRPWNLGFDLALDPVARGERVTPAPAPVGSRVRLGVELRDGPLGRGSVGASYARSVTGGTDALQVRAAVRLDPDWDLFARGDVELAGGSVVRAGVRWRPAPAWELEAALRLPRPAVDGALRWRGEGVALEAAGAAGVDGWFRGHLEARAAFAALDPAWAAWELRARTFGGLASAATPTADRFSVGPATGLRGAAPDVWAATAVGVGNLEIARRLGDNQAVLEAALIAPWAWAFADAAAFDAGAGAPGSAWAFGVGGGLEGSLFGFVPFYLGIDLAYGLPSARWSLGLRTGPSYPAPLRR